MQYQSQSIIVSSRQVSDKVINHMSKKEEHEENHC